MGIVPFWARVDGIDEPVLVIGFRWLTNTESFLIVHPRTKQLLWRDSFSMLFEKLYQEDVKGE